MGVSQNYLSCDDGRVLLITHSPRKYVRVHHYIPDTRETVIKEYGEKPKACDSD